MTKRYDQRSQDLSCLIVKWASHVCIVRYTELPSRAWTDRHERRFGDLTRIEGGRARSVVADSAIGRRRGQAEAPARRGPCEASAVRF